MKNRYLVIFVILFLSAFNANGQGNTKKINPVGIWKFEAPTAEQGYSSGLITIALADKKHTAAISFTGSEYKVPGENVKFSGDSIQFSVYLEGEDIKIFLRLESDKKMAGKAVTSGSDVIPLSAIKEAPASK